VLEGFSASPGRRKLRERNATRKTSESSFFADGAISSGTICGNGKQNQNGFLAAPESPVRRVKPLTSKLLLLRRSYFAADP
jgi:hypothetical protein